MDYKDFFQSLEVAFWLTLILDIIILIAFFVLCANVAAIKKKLRNEFATLDTFALYIGMGQKEKAKEVLIDLIKSDKAIRDALEGDFVEKELKISLQQYAKAMEMVDLLVDIAKVEEVKKLLNNPTN
jgi:hypothetical protein